MVTLKPKRNKSTRKKPRRSSSLISREECCTMSNIKRLTEFENAMETICDECKARHDLHYNYCEEQCMVRPLWYEIIDEQKKEREDNTMELSTVANLIEQLKLLNPNTPVYVGGTQGYLHIQDNNGKAVVSFDDCEEI